MVTRNGIEKGVLVDMGDGEVVDIFGLLEINYQSNTPAFRLPEDVSRSADSG
jgi:hypothetical protein